MFFGLGANIKFPANFVRSPYTIVAAAVTTLPQRVEFPFSLINPPADVHPGMSPALNEIMPGWVLSDNLYAVRRNEEKYKARNEARRTAFVFDVLRKDIVDMMIDARRRLIVSTPRNVYTSADIEGLGKNYMREPSRVKAIETYVFFIKYYALLGLKKQVETLLSQQAKQELADILTRHSEDKTWEHQRRIMAQELPGNSVQDNLRLLIQMQGKIARDTEMSKERDDIRGKRVIDDYLDVHTLAKQDSFVKQTWAQTRQLGVEIQELLKQL